MISFIFTAGNKRFRGLIDDFAPKYVEATTKLEKTQVIATVIDRVRADSPNGGFIKKDFYTGRWYEIGNEKARDKVGHAIRKAAEELMKRKGLKKTSRTSVAKEAISEKAKASASHGKDSPKQLRSPLSESAVSPAGVGLRGSVLSEAAALEGMARGRTLIGNPLTQSLMGRTPLTQASWITDGQVMPSLLGGGASSLLPSLGSPYLMDAQQSLYLSNLRAQTLQGALAGSDLRTLELQAANQDATLRRLAALRELEMAQKLGPLPSQAASAGLGGGANPLPSAALSQALAAAPGRLDSLLTQRNEQGVPLYEALLQAREREEATNDN